MIHLRPEPRPAGPAPSPRSSVCFWEPAVSSLCSPRWRRSSSTRSGISPPRRPTSIPRASWVSSALWPSCSSALAAGRAQRPPGRVLPQGGARRRLRALPSFPGVSGARPGRLLRVPHERSLDRSSDRAPARSRMPGRARFPRPARFGPPARTARTGGIRRRDGTLRRSRSLLDRGLRRAAGVPVRRDRFADDFGLFLFQNYYENKT